MRQRETLLSASLPSLPPTWRLKCEIMSRAGHRDCTAEILSGACLPAAAFRSGVGGTVSFTFGAAVGVADAREWVRW